MKNRVVMLMVALVSLTAVAMTYWWNLRTERDIAAELTARVAATEIAPPGQASERQLSVSSIQPSTKTVPSNPESSAATKASPIAAAAEALMPVESPEATRSWLQQLYPDIEDALGISRQEALELIDLLVNREQDENAIAMLHAMADPAEASRDAAQNACDVTNS